MCVCVCVCVDCKFSCNEGLPYKKDESAFKTCVLSRLRVQFTKYTHLYYYLYYLSLVNIIKNIEDNEVFIPECTQTAYAMRK